MRSILMTLLAVASPACGQPTAPDGLVPALERMAARDNAEAIYFLGMAYQTGTGVPTDPVRALGLFRRAEKLGDPLAAYKVGCFYAGQYGVIAPDAAQALHYKSIAARAGYALAQQDVGSLRYDAGEFASAKDWFAKAAAQGTSDALMAYASIHNDMPGFASDRAVTAAYFRLFLARNDGSDRQRQWLADFEETLSADDRARTDAIVRDYRPLPTALTIRALSGVRAAEALVAGMPR